MTEKKFDFHSPTSPDPGDGVNRSKFNFFPEQHQHKPTTKTFVPGQRTCMDPGFFCQEGGGGVQAPQLILQFTEGVQWSYYTFFRGGGSNFSQGGVQLPISIETNITITCDFPRGGGGLEPIYPSGSAHFGTNRLRRACAASF